ncbi:MAG: hypothetical protein A2X77_05485 [Gammaproteobacteria bacterium GWE2_42_36]|nr:MAG: hypothetical protein A2X77_05485 [Gammaproteobacteria bacterium GWE2_42_36]
MMIFYRCNKMALIIDTGEHICQCEVAPCEVAPTKIMVLCCFEWVRPIQPSILSDRSTLRSLVF